MSAAPLTIADGHHRYETALRYRAERAARRACESDPAWDYVLALVYPLDEAPAGAAHAPRPSRAARGNALLEQLRPMCAIEPLADRAALLAAMAQAPRSTRSARGPGGSGCAQRLTAATLSTRDPDTVEGLLSAELSAPSRGLDVNALSVVSSRSRATMPARWRAPVGSATSRTPRMPLAQVERGGLDSFLLDAMPPRSSRRVAQAGEVMPQKSTYFHPKAPAGLLFSPMEW